MSEIEAKYELQTKGYGGALDARDVRRRVNLIQEVMQSVMKKDVHFGVIPGCQKPSLYKPGAEVLAMTFSIAIKSETEDLSNYDEKRYRVTCTAYSSNCSVLGSAVGECSSNEEKYKWRRPVCEAEFEECPVDRKREKWTKNGKIKQIRTEPSDLANTILQMADKRAYVSLVRKVTAASDIFTQDVEDIPEELRPDENGNGHSEAKPQIEMPKPKTQPPAKQETTVVPGGGDFKAMKSKYAGKCKGCPDPVVAGDDIYFSKTLGTYHADCHDRVFSQEPGANG
jgi:hypothetical protein